MARTMVFTRATCVRPPAGARRAPARQEVAGPSRAGPPRPRWSHPQLHLAARSAAATRSLARSASSSPAANSSSWRAPPCGRGPWRERLEAGAGADAGISVRRIAPMSVEGQAVPDPIRFRCRPEPIPPRRSAPRTNRRARAIRSFTGPYVGGGLPESRSWGSGERAPPGVEPRLDGEARPRSREQVG